MAISLTYRHVGSYTPTNCAERTAFFRAVYEGERAFTKIAVVGGPEALYTITDNPQSPAINSTAMIDNTIKSSFFFLELVFIWQLCFCL